MTESWNQLHLISRQRFEIVRLREENRRLKEKQLLRIEKPVLLISNRVWDPHQYLKFLLFLMVCGISGDESKNHEIEH
jgi:hypothetical protein